MTIQLSGGQNPAEAPSRGNGDPVSRDPANISPENIAAVPAISVVMAAFNAAATLERSIGSVMAQTERSWELIIVDDGSRDDTALVAAGWASRDNRIRVVSQPNMGASQARNRGLKEARGDWIVFFDADDTMHPRHFALMLQAVRSTPTAQGAACGWARVDTRGRRTFSVIPNEEYFSFEYIYRYGPATIIHAFLLPRRILLREGGFDVRFKTGEDWDLWIRLARIGVQFAIVPKVLAFYWDSGGSLTKDVEQLLRDDITIRALARQPDSRLSSVLPVYAQGMQRDNPAQEFLITIIYWGGRHLAGGKNFGHLFVLIPRFQTLPPPCDFAEVLCCGLQMDVPGGRPGIIACWPAIRESAQDFLNGLESWSGIPGLATAILDELEVKCLLVGRFSGTVALTHSLGINLFSLASLRGVPEVSRPIDRLTVKLRLFGRNMIVAKIPLFGPISGWQIYRSVARRALRHVERRAIGNDIFAKCLRRAGPATANIRRKGHALGILRDRPLRIPKSLARIVDEETASVAKWQRPAVTPLVIPTTHPDEDSVEGWDRFYEQEDPWGYDNPYEQQKYDDTLELIPAFAGAALELGCSEGRFTEKLAARGAPIVASDISARALERAARRCDRFDNVHFQVLDAFHEDLGEDWGLIVCSEILYYLYDKAALDALAKRLFAAIRPGGTLVHAHARSIDDDPSRSGVDWSLAFGGDHIADVLARVGFVCRKTTDRALYRVDQFQKPPVSEPQADPVVVRREIACALPDRVAGGVVWGGAIQTRNAVEANERRRSVPVLAYHRIVDDGPEDLALYRVSPRQFEEQLRFLRRRGYRHWSPAGMAAHARDHGSLPGRAIVITFDDGYTDFHDTAWPILVRNGFSAHNFIVTERVGGHADWDAQYGQPAPLMDWEQIVHLAAQGATFGSHLATHTAATRMRPEALFREAVRSRLKLEKALGVPIDTVATPFSLTNGLVEGLLRQAGYRQHFGDDEGALAPVASNSLLIPRLFVTSDLDLDAFGWRIDSALAPPEAADRIFGDESRRMAHAP